jgi:hypothetical protein
MPIARQFLATAMITLIAELHRALSAPVVLEPPSARKDTRHGGAPPRADADAWMFALSLTRVDGSNGRRHSLVELG